MNQQIFITSLFFKHDKFHIRYSAITFSSLQKSGIRVIFHISHSKSEESHCKDRNRTTSVNLNLMQFYFDENMMPQTKTYRKMCMLASIILQHNLPHNLLDIAFSALTLLVGWQEGHQACKKTWVVGAGMVICLGSGQICIWPSRCYCHSLSLAPVDPDWFYLSGTCSPG